MARVKGRDVVIELLDTVAKLEATVTKHADLLESLAKHAMSTSAELTTITGLWADVSQRVADVSERVADVSERVADVSERVGKLEHDFHDLAEGFVKSAQMARVTQGHFGRLAQIIAQAVGDSDSRFEDIEARLSRLEKKTG